MCQKLLLLTATDRNDNVNLFFRVIINILKTKINIHFVYKYSFLKIDIYGSLHHNVNLIEITSKIL